MRKDMRNSKENLKLPQLLRVICQHGRFLQPSRFKLTAWTLNVSTSNIYVNTSALYLKSLYSLTPVSRKTFWWEIQRLVKKLSSKLQRMQTHMVSFLNFHRYEIYISWWHDTLESRLDFGRFHDCERLFHVKLLICDSIFGLGCLQFSKI